MGMGRKGTIPLLKIHSVLHHLKYASAHLVLTNTQNGGEAPFYRHTDGGPEMVGSAEGTQK